MHPTLASAHGRRRTLVAAMGLAASLALFATGALAQGVVTLETPAPPGAQPSGGPGASPTPPTDPQEAMLAYVQCMRDHGVDMPDPEFGPDGRVFMRVKGRGGGGPGLSGGPGDPDFQAAQDACGSLVEGTIRELDPEQQAEMQARALEFAQCMRDHGVDMPDPRFDANGGMTMQIGGGGQQPDPDAMQAAQEACQDLTGPAPGDGDTAERGPSSDTEGQPEASEVIP